MLTSAQLYTNEHFNVDVVEIEISYYIKSCQHLNNPSTDKCRCVSEFGRVFVAEHYRLYQDLYLCIL